MKKTSLVFPLLMVGLTYTALAAMPPQGVKTLYGDWSGIQAIWTTTAVWKEHPDDTPFAWVQGSYGIVSAVRAAGDSFSLNGLEFWGIRFDHSSNSDARWDSGSNCNAIGAGGIEFTSNGAITAGSSTGATRLRLSASQTWKGPATTGTPAYFSVGHDNYQSFYMASATSTVECTDLTITGNLSTWFTWTNHFENTAIRVEKPARIWLEKSWVNNEERIGAPQLNARQLTLSGDGVMWTAGGVSPVGNARGRYPLLEGEMNAETVAPVLTLEDGADLSGTGAGWDIAELAVGGGTSEFTGDWTFRRESTAVSIAADSTLRFSGSCCEEVGLSAGLDVSGTGVLEIDPSKYGLSGTIDLGVGVTLRLSGSDIRIPIPAPVTGFGTIEISAKAAGITVIPAGKLTGFSGTVKVVSGEVYFESLPAGITVTTSGSGIIHTDETLPIFYADWSVNPAVWYDAKRQIAAFLPNTWAIVEKTPTTTCNFYGTMHFHGLRNDAERKTNFWLSRADFHVGSGGIAFTAAGDLAFGGTMPTPMLTIDADQTWSGPASGSDYATLQIGFPGYGHAGYHRTTLGIGDDVGMLKISGRLAVYFASTNDLARVDVEVASPSHLVLCDRWTSGSTVVTGDAHLGAKSLTLSGDGDDGLMLGETGVSYPYGASALSTIRTIDAEYVAKALTLKDGADLTAAQPVRFDLPGLSVAGTGTSVLSGEFDIVRSEWAIALSDGVALDLSSATIRESVLGTALSVTGTGNLKLGSGFGLTGSISLGEDVDLVLDGFDSLDNPIAGGASLEIAAAGKTLFVSAAMLAGFTGDTITVTAGTVVFESIPADVSLVEKGGVALRTTDPSDGTMFVTDIPRSESTITLQPGDRLLICGTGLTESTELVLAGGAVEFVRSTTISSPIRYAANSTIGSVKGVTGTVAGFITASNENAAVICQLSLAGNGTVNLSGGGVFERVRLFLTQGSANLTGGHFIIARQSWGIYEGGEHLGIGGTATVECPYPNEGGIHSLYCRPKYGSEAVIEISTGGVVRLEQNVALSIGRADNTVSMPGTLRLSGGKLEINRGYQLLLGGGTDGGRGRLELRDGEFLTDQAIAALYTGVTGGGEVCWHGGTIKLGEEFFSFSGNPSHRLDGTSSNIAFRILGPDCRLDLNGATAFTNVLANANNIGSWTAGPGACLTVANGGTCVFQRFPDGGAIGVDGCSALIDDPSGPQIGTVIFRGTGVDVVRTTAVLPQDVSVVVATEGEWGEGQLEGLVLHDLLFEGGAGLRLVLQTDGTVVPVSVPGIVSCKGALGVDFVRTGGLPPAGRSVLLSAVGGLTAPTSVVGLSKATRGATFSVEENDLVATIVRSGLILLFR